jgi:tRNA threonylcarbamoyladenosine biosynthesis protein TsaB
VITLAVDASTYTGSVCVTRSRDVLAAREVAMRDAHHERLMPAIADALGEAAVQMVDVDRIVCGAGPGSFTSLRIGAALAKGLAMATGKPLYAVSSMALMVGAVDPPLDPGEYIAALDALRGEFYVAPCLVDEMSDVVNVGPVSLMRLDELESLEQSGRATVGEGRRVRAAPKARGIVRVEALLGRDGSADLAMWEPGYGRVAEAQRRWEAAHGRALPRV